MPEEVHELIDFSPSNPVKVFIHKLGNVSKHWHQDLELLMVLEGEVLVMVDDCPCSMKSDDLILINPNAIHELHSEGCVMIALQIRLSDFDKTAPDMANTMFCCNTATDEDKNRYNDIKFIIATLVKSSTDADGSTYQHIALIYYLFSILMRSFKTDMQADTKKSRKHLSRLTKIMDYIEEHYRENFTLNQLAEHESLSVPYLSSFFSKYMGMGFSQYYTNVKLEHAIKDLLQTSRSIEEIAVSNGFTEPHAFVRAFKKKFNTLPSRYRKEKTLADPSADRYDLVHYLSVEPTHYLHLLTKYLSSGAAAASAPAASETRRLPTPIDVQSQGVALRHTFRKFLTVGRAKDLLHADIRKMISDIQMQIGFEYIKFHGIFSDDMMVCHRKGDTLHFSFTMIDMALDFLLSVKLKPLVQFSFMPEALASDPGKTVFQTRFITSPPKRMDEWNALVKAFMGHIIDRYGMDEVKNWLYCVWNEPDTSKKMFGFYDDADFYALYENTYRTVKTFSKELCFGSPSMFMTADLSLDWARTFIGWALRQQCPPDFMNVHYYSDQFPNALDVNFSHAPGSKLPKTPDDFPRFITRAKNLFAEFSLNDRPVYLTEWNFTVSHRNLINDTCYKSCYVMKNLLENYDALDSFGYWSLTDLIEENPIPEQLFHGGMGMHTMNGIRKSVYYAYDFANKLGNRLIARGDGYFLTRQGDSLQLITYHYKHYNHLFSEGELFDMTPLNRYTPFEMTAPLTISLILTGLTADRYKVRTYSVSPAHGSAFDEWAAAGGLELGPDDVAYLSGQAQPALRQFILQPADQVLNFAVSLDPLEIRLSLISPLICF